MSQAPVEPGQPDRRGAGDAEVLLIVCPVCRVDIIATVSFAVALGAATADDLADTPVTLTPQSLRVSHTCGVITHSTGAA